MPTIDLKIVNCKIADGFRIYDADLLIEEEKISAIVKDSTYIKADNVLDAKHNLVIPGVIDVHVHFWDPGYTHREDWKTGTASAAAGGVTTVIDMPSTSSPLTITEEAFKLKKEIADKKAVIDFSIHGGVTPDTLSEIPKIARLGAAAFKMFMHEDIRGFKKVNTKVMYQAFKIISQLSHTAIVHAEDPIVTVIKEEFIKEGRRDPESHCLSRPSFAEEMAIFTATTLALQLGTHLHVAHLTSRKGLRVAMLAKEMSSRITTETCPHYLIFTMDDMKRLGPFLKINPPLRAKEDKEALWRALALGNIDIVATDHCPYPKREKETGWKDIWTVGSGIPGVETLLPLMFYEGYVKGRISLNRLIDALCKKPAKIFGIDYRKGGIAIGLDADLVIIDHRKEFTIKSEKMHTKADFTPYEGMKVKGYPRITIVRGKIIAEEGQIIAKEGYGEFIERKR